LADQARSISGSSSVAASTGSSSAAASSSAEAAIERARSCSCLVRSLAMSWSNMIVQRATALSTLTQGHCHARMGNLSYNISRILTLYERLQGSRTYSTGSGNGIPF